MFVPFFITFGGKFIETVFAISVKHGLILTACQMLRKLQSGKQQTKAGRIILTTKNKNSMAYNRHAIFILLPVPSVVRTKRSSDNANRQSGNAALPQSVYSLLSFACKVSCYVVHISAHLRLNCTVAHSHIRTFLHIMEIKNILKCS